MPEVQETRLIHVNCFPNYFWECQVAYWVWRIFPVCSIFIGTCGNILNLIILSRKNVRKFSTSVYLLFLTVSDLAFLWCTAFRDTIYAVTGRNPADESEFNCKLLYWLSLTFASSSVWILVLLTIERVMMTRAPVFSWQRLSPRVAVVACSVLLCVAAVLNSHTLYGFTLYDIDKFNATFGETDARLSVVKQFPCFYSSPGYRLLYEKYWSPTVLILYTVIPMIIIIIGNINIATTIIIQKKKSMKIRPAENSRRISSKICDCNSSEQRKKCVCASKHAHDVHGSIDDVIKGSGDTTLGGSRGRMSINTKNNKSATRLLFALSVFFVVTTLPYCVYYVIKGYLTHVSFRDIARLQLTQAVVHNMLFCNFSFNFFFYFASGTVFKQEWTRLTSNARRKIRELSCWKWCR